MIKIILKEQKEPVKIDLNLIVDTIKEYDPSINIISIYHYGSSFTGEYGKTFKDTYGDIDIGVVVDRPLDEDAWYDSEQYEFLATENYDVSLTHKDSEIWEPRKLIHGQQSLNERRSDIKYEKAISFMMKELLNPDNLTEFKMLLSKQFAAGYFQCYFAQVKEEAKQNLDKKYEEYLRTTNDLSAMASPLIKSFEAFKQVFDEFLVIFAPKDANPQAGATMSVDGKLTIYVSQWRAEEVFGIDQNTSKEEIELLKINFRRTAFPKDVLVHWLENPDSTFETILHHELTHYLNSLRSGDRQGLKRKPYRAKGGNKQFDTSTTEYINSTEEIQARFGEVESYMNYIIHKTPDQDNISYQLLYRLGMKQKEQFMRTFFYNFICPPPSLNPTSRAYWLGYNIKNKKRIINRVADVYENFANREPADNLLAVINHMKTSYPLFDINKYPPIVLDNPPTVDESSLPVDRESYPEDLKRDLNRRALNTRLMAYKLNKQDKGHQRPPVQQRTDDAERSEIEKMNAILSKTYKNNFSPEAKAAQKPIVKNDQEAGSIKKFFKSLLGL